jgi:hypothetical protein
MSDIAILFKGEFNLARVDNLPKEIKDFSITDKDTEYLISLYPCIKDNIQNMHRSRTYISNSNYKDYVLYYTSNAEYEIIKMWRGTNLAGTEFKGNLLKDRYIPELGIYE